MYTYGFRHIKNCSPKKISAKELASWRTGLSPANPAGALLLAKRIDDLTQELDVLKANVLKSKESSEKEMREVLSIISEMIESSRTLAQFEKQFFTGFGSK
jgi:hypothetical protein